MSVCSGNVQVNKLILFTCALCSITIIYRDQQGDTCHATLCGVCTYLCLPFVIRSYPVLVHHESLEFGPHRLSIQLPHIAENIHALLEVCEAFTSLVIPVEIHHRCVCCNNINIDRIFQSVVVFISKSQILVAYIM